MVAFLLLISFKQQFQITEATQAVLQVPSQPSMHNIGKWIRQDMFFSADEAGIFPSIHLIVHGKLAQAANPC